MGCAIASKNVDRAESAANRAASAPADKAGFSAALALVFGVLMRYDSVGRTDIQGNIMIVDNVGYRK
jgi:hypothetical protein